MGRYNSPNILRQYVHRQIYERFLKYIKPGMKVVNVGEKEGILSALIAEKGAFVYSIESSRANLLRARKFAKKLKVEKKIKFILKKPNKTFLADDFGDLVVSCFALEHIKDFDKGLLELKRIAKKRIIFAVPTCFNLCAFLILGGGNYWSLSGNSFVCFFKGLLRVLTNIFSEGVEEKQKGMDFLHVWRYPWRVFKRIKKAGLKVVRIEATTIGPPFFLTYFQFLRPAYRLIDRFTSFSILKYLGYGTVFVVEK